jgi:hypothetical protein
MYVRGPEWTWAHLGCAIPPIIHFNGIFPYTPSILDFGYPHFQETSMCVCVCVCAVAVEYLPSFPCKPFPCALFITELPQISHLWDLWDLWDLWAMAADQSTEPMFANIWSQHLWLPTGAGET